MANIKGETRKPKKVNFIYHIINIKLQSNLRKGPEAYKEIIKSIFESKTVIKLNQGKNVMIRTLHEKQIEGETIITGKIGRYTRLETKQWFDQKNWQVRKPEIPDDWFPNLQETDYFFIPSIHRLIIRKATDFTIFNAYEFFSRAAHTSVMPGEIMLVNLEQSSDVFDKILKAPYIERLQIDISYTNSDISKGAIKWMDDELKDGQVGNVSFIFEADDKKSINIDTTLISGALGMAQNNGFAEATIRNENRKRLPKIKTKDYPKQIKTSAQSEDEVADVIFKETLKAYRDDT